MVFYPMLLLGIYLSLRHRDFRVMPLIVGCFFAYWIFVRHELMLLDIVIYVAAMVVAVQLTRRWRLIPAIRKLWPLWLVDIIFIMVLTGYLTYNAPDWLIFSNNPT